MVLAPIMLMIFLWKPIDFIKSISSSKSFSSVSIAVAKNKKLEIQKQSPRGVLRNFTKFSRKLLCHSLFFNNVTGKRPATLLKKETLAQMFSCEFCEISKNTPFYRNLWWLVLQICNTITNLSFIFKSRVEAKCRASNDYQSLQKVLAKTSNS